MDTICLLNKGIEYVKARRLAEVLDWFNIAVQHEPGNRYAWQNKGFCLQEMDRPNEAVSCFDKMIELDPKNAEAWAWKADVLLGLDKYPEAIMCFDKALELEINWDFPKEARQFAMEQLGASVEKKKIEKVTKDNAIFGGFSGNGSLNKITYGKAHAL